MLPTIKFFSCAALGILAAVGAMTVPPPGALLVANDQKDCQCGSPFKFPTIQAALSSLDQTSNATIFVYPGKYDATVVNRSGPTTIIGYTTDSSTYEKNTVLIWNNVSSLVVGSNDASGALRVSTKNFRLYNVDVQNAFTRSQAIALSAQATQGGYYGCRFLGFQDTVLANVGDLFFSRSYIEGAVDYIFGINARAYFQNCTIASVRSGCVTASGRNSEASPGVYVFNGCNVTQTPTAAAGTTGAVYLGRPWNLYAKILVMNSYLGPTVHKAGWSMWNSKTGPYPNVTINWEYNNSGPGAWNSLRANWSRLITPDVADQYSVNGTFAGNTAWIDPAYLQG